MNGPYLYIVQQIINVYNIKNQHDICHRIPLVAETMSDEITFAVDKFYAGTATGLLLVLIPFIAVA